MGNGRRAAEDSPFFARFLLCGEAGADVTRFQLYKPRPAGSAVGPAATAAYSLQYRSANFRGRATFIHSGFESMLVSCSDHRWLMKRIKQQRKQDREGGGQIHVDGPTSGGKRLLLAVWQVDFLEKARAGLGLSMTPVPLVAVIGISSQTAANLSSLPFGKLPSPSELQAKFGIGSAEVAVLRRGGRHGERPVVAEHIDMHALLRLFCIATRLAVRHVFFC